MMHLPKDYLDDLLVRMTHHSCAIENNTITLSETVSILIYQMIPGKVSVREFYELENHRIAFNYIIESINQELTISLIHDVHSLLMDRLDHEKGHFKSHENVIVGATFPTASPKETPLLMDQWLLNLNNRIQKAKSSDDIILSICSSHIAFERIHPYKDGNGRTGRLIMMHLLLKNRVVPLVILKDQKHKYFQFLDKQDTEGFTVYTTENINKDRQRYNAFLNSLSKE
ncbi:Fic family protein [Paenibacillus sp. ACRSA]|uniref:Fic family protein n=1 Tax=Paenibacillus sp. ACRSA TaxID=2918211 RepID=UPI001EF52304|nr:Fic family protein [Paenibacillus sp. ACRSA]MCG7380066.1 Fic family protein [Paenibacillus sp. ACRSA]